MADLSKIRWNETDYNLKDAAAREELLNKYDKIGGEISGNVTIDGTLTLDIDNPDYNSGITFSKSLNDNLGTILTLTGYADNTNYQPIIRNIHDPVNNQDVATKKYVDDNLSVPNYHIVFLNLDGTVDQTSIASTIVYSEISAHLTNRTQSDYLDVFWDQTRFYAKCLEIIDINTGDLKFIGEVEFDGMQRYIVFTLTPQNVLTTTSIITFESISNKVTSVINYPTSTTKYPTTKAIFDEFCRKPEVIWEVTDTSQGLKALQIDISAQMDWQLTNLDFSPYKRIKIYSVGSQGQTNAGTTSAMILEMSLDPRMAITSKGGHYVGSILSQKPNDANRYASLTCAVSADKTSFAVLRQTSLYGTAATTNNDIGANVVLIEGYFDDADASPNSNSSNSDIDLSEYLKKSDLAAWAKSARKPTYIASEVGALPDNTTYVSTVNGQSGPVTISEYDDTAITNRVATLENTPLALATSDNLVSTTDRHLLNSLNPNILRTISNINASEFNIINAKEENTVGLVIAAEPIISEQIRTINLLDVNNTFGNYYIGANGATNASTSDILGDFISVNPGDDIYYTGHVGETTASSVNRRLHVYTADKTWIKQISFAGSLRVGQDWSTHGVVPSNGAYVRVSWGTTDTNLMITVGAPTKYYPYYMTPFINTTSVDFKIGTTNDSSEAITYTFNVPETVGDLYGLKFNPISGKIWKVTGHIDSYNGETLPDHWLSDRDLYVEGTTPQIGAEVVYRLANEDIIEYDCTPIVIPLNYHENYFFIENGLFNELSYYAETLAVDHLTIYSGATFGDTNILETDVIEWNRATELIDTKADLVDAQLTGNVTAPTLSTTANSDRIATTAFVQSMLHTLASFETTVKASKNYEVGEYLTHAGNLYKVTAAVAKNANLTVGTNIEVTDVATELNLLRSLIQS